MREAVIFDVEFDSAGLLPSEAVVEGALLAEKKGFDTVWKGETNSRDPVVLLSAIAARTRSVKIATSILHIFARSPVATGIMATTLDELSCGRFMLGLGVANKVLASWHGSDFHHPLQGIREYIEIVRRVIHRERVEYRGKMFLSKDFRLSFEPYNKEVRIFLAALGPKMARLAGELCDGVIINQADPKQIGFIADKVKEGSEKVGKDFEGKEIVCKVRCAVNDDLEAAKRQLKKIITFYGLADYYKDMFARMGFGKEVEALRKAWLENGFNEATKQVSDEMLEHLPNIAATSLNEVKRKLGDYADSGATRLILVYVPSTESPAEEMMRFLEKW